MELRLTQKVLALHPDRTQVRREGRQDAEEGKDVAIAERALDVGVNEPGAQAGFAFRRHVQCEKLRAGRNVLAAAGDLAFLSARVAALRQSREERQVDGGARDG